MLGVLLGSIVDKFSSPHWRPMFLAGTPLASILLLSFIFITPFSPRWLATKGRDAEARKVLMTLRGGDSAAVDAELADIVAAVEASKGSSPWASLMQPWVLRAVGVGIGLAFVQQWSSVNTVNSYAPDVLRKAGYDTSDSLTQNIYIVRGVPLLHVTSCRPLALDVDPPWFAPSTHLRRSRRAW